MSTPYTVAGILGELVFVITPHPALDRDDECSECGAALVHSTTVYLADCGRYCSKHCAESHAQFLADAMNKEVL